MIKVVLVEDNIDICDTIHLLLRGSEGVTYMDAFYNAEEAIKAIPILQPDVVIVDINLPGKSGIEMIAQLKPLFPEVQFIIFTVFEDNDNIFSALKAGATGYLLKSYLPVKIIDAITEVFHGGSPMSSQIARKVLGSFCQSPLQELRDCPKLTSREQEILDFLAKGYRYKEIGEKLYISTETVRTHIRNIYQKLQVESGIEAINKVYGGRSHLKG